MKRLALSVISVSLLLTAAAARADDLSITLTQPFQTTVEPDTLPNVLVFNATVTNNTSGALYLNGDSFSIDSPLTIDDTPYANGFPLSLGAGASYTGALFDVDVPAVLPYVGLFAGSFEILGGSSSSVYNDLGSANFDVVAPTPEPSSFLLLATGLAALGGALLRRRLAGERGSAASLGA